MGLVVMPVNLVLVLLLLAVSVQCLAQVTVPDTLPNGSLRRVWSFSIGVIAQPTRSSLKKLSLTSSACGPGDGLVREPCGIQSAARSFLEFRAMTDDPLASR